MFVFKGYGVCISYEEISGTLETDKLPKPRKLSKNSGMAEVGAAHKIPLKSGGTLCFENNSVKFRETEK